MCLSARYADLLPRTPCRNNRTCRREAARRSFCSLSRRALAPFVHERAAFAAVSVRYALSATVTAFAKILMAPFNRENSNRFIDAVSVMPEVVECYTITGDGAFLLKIVARNFQDYRDFVYDHILTIPNVANIDSSIVVATEKKTNVIPLD